MKVSAGVLLINPSGHLLVCQASLTNPPRWDIPKGLIDECEEPIAAAVRELKEETGVDVSAKDLIDLGLFNYVSGKKLHLFVAINQDISVQAMHCQSTFEHPYKAGVLVPEMCDFAWIELTEESLIEKGVGKSLVKVLKQIIPTIQTIKK